MNPKSTIFSAVAAFSLLTNPLVCRAAAINLARPVSDSIAVDKLNWKFDETSGETVANSAASGATYDGELATGSAGNSPSFVPGVDRPGTSGYGNSVNLPTGGSSAVDNSSVYWNADDTSDDALDLVGEDFTGGAWINFNLIDPAEQRVVVMDRGTYSAGYSFGLGLLKTLNAGNGNAYQWRVEIQVGGNSASNEGNETRYSAFLPVGTINVGEWNHFGFAYDYAENPGENLATLYLNGSKLATVAFSESIAISNARRKLHVGERSVFPYNSSFDGKVDDLFFTSGLHTFTAVPEPATIAFVISGSLGLMIWMRRRRQTRGPSGFST